MGNSHDWADTFATKVKNMYPSSKGYSQTLRTWIWEAAHHYYWQMVLTARFGPSTAKLIGDSHETGLFGDSVSVDRIVDSYQNARARQDAKHYYEALVASATPSTVDLEGILSDGRSPDFTNVMSSQWDKVKERVEKEIQSHIIRLIASTVDGKDVGNRVILDAYDPFLTKDLGLPRSLPAGNGRPGWPPK
jgi:hypothetical protein